MPQAYSASFARAYNLRWGFFVRQAAPLIRAYYEATPLRESERTLLDLCCSTFDALNHLPDEIALLNCFKSVKSVLKPGGCFVFDLNTATGLRRWNGMAVDDSNPEALVINRGFLIKKPPILSTFNL